MRESKKAILHGDRKIHVAKENYCAFEGNELCSYADMGNYKLLKGYIFMSK